MEVEDDQKGKEDEEGEVAMETQDSLPEDTEKVEDEGIEVCFRVFIWILKIHDIILLKTQLKLDTKGLHFVLIPFIEKNIKKSLRFLVPFLTVVLERHVGESWSSGYRVQIPASAYIF